MKKLALVLCLLLVVLLVSPVALGQCPCSRCRLGNCIPSYFGYCYCEPVGMGCQVDFECAITRPANEEPGEVTDIAKKSLTALHEAKSSARASAVPCGANRAAGLASAQYKVLFVEVF